MKKLVPLLSMLISACGVGTAGSIAGDDQDLGSEAAALCSVSRQELMITDLSVVEDPVRTVWTGSLTDPKDGAWTFGRLMTQMAGSNDPSVFTQNLFDKWLTDQSANGFTVSARTRMQTTVLDPWKKLPDGRLDLTKAPLRLLAVVDRFDLRKLSQGNAGEGRFVFGVLDSNGNPLQFTVILEYKLPAANKADLIAWANSWHALGALKVPSARYNTALQAITDRFAGAGVAQGNPNGSSISQVRTNEIALSTNWELREFHLETDGQLHEATTANAPDRSFNNSAELADFINQNAAALIAGKKTIPLSFEGGHFRAASLNNFINFWQAPGVQDNDARFGLSVNTCDGCHGRETNTTFLQVAPRAKGVQTNLSGFLLGEDVTDPVDSKTSHHFADLDRRASDLATVVCPVDQTDILTDAPTERVE